MPDFAWLQASALGRAVATSLTLTAGRLVGVILPKASFVEVLRAGRVVILTGLVVSVGTGLALFSARATTVIESTAFQLKMSLLLTAVVIQIVIWRRARHDAGAEPSMVLMGVLGLMLWLGLAVSACWFILFE
jgi:hypothetical protein